MFTKFSVGMEGLYYVERTCYGTHALHTQNEKYNFDLVTCSSRNIIT